MRIFIPFTHLRSETYLACINAAQALSNDCVNIWPIRDHEHGYADYWVERWQEGRKFINVEQDVVPHKSVLEEMWDCPEDYCICQYAYPWAGSPIDHSPIGCAKFSEHFIAAHQGIMLHRQHWHEPQHIIINATLNKFHLHTPPALHLHVTDQWPMDARRKYETPR